MKKTIKLTSVVAAVALVLTSGSSFAFGGGFNGYVQDREVREAKREEMREVMISACQNNDYEAWVNVAGNKMSEIVTSENFSKFCEMHELMEKAKTIGDELGFKQGGKFHKKGKFGMRKGECIKKEVKQD